ncbi:MAG TPA: hypothetical protein VMQ86_14400 [Bryobacteraceae bacterium]|jgi:hypothetical protein|nr:hypothetical protein [Bryobacteraceae bacterium]
MAPQVELTGVLREQLEYLIDHSARNPQCGCSECQRYLKVRAALLEIFAETPRAKVQEIAPQLAKAA